MAKQTPVATKTVDLEAKTVTITFADDTFISVALDDLSEEMRIRAALHGLSQRLGDSYAGAGQEPDPIAYAKDAATSVLEAIKNGNWAVRAGGAGGPRVTMLAEAIAAASGTDIESVVEMLSNIDSETDEGKKQLAALRSHPAIKKELARIRAERAAEKAAKEAAANAEAEMPDLTTLLGG